MDLTRITVEPLGRQHDRTAFSCGAEALDRYLRQQARQDADKRAAAPFVAVICHACCIRPDPAGATIT